MLQISLLGPLEVRRDGELVPVPGGKTSELLVRLALDAGVLVRTERLLDDLWGADAITTSRNTLQSKVAKLRRALRDPAVIGGEGGYTLAVEPSEVDALVVLREVGDATRLLGDGDDRGAADLCTAALGRYRGDLLQAAGGDWVEPHRARLEAARMTLLETQLSARLRLGDVADVIGELESAVADHPFQEAMWELLITALYRAGRQADALAAYQRVRGQLADELGLDPGPRLQQLEQLILAHDASLHVVPRALGAFDAPTGNLPSLTAELVGRETELAELSDLLARERLVEIVGPGGIGKTALGIAAGRRSASDVGAGGVWLARLETTTTADEVVDTLIAATGVTGGEPALLERLKGADTLVILDNCEHVIDAAAALVVRLLDATSELRILCTSQVPLDIDGEVVFELAPLSTAHAAELFTRRAGANRRAHGISATDEAVLELCRSLDGLPLAIELAAARTKTLSIDEIIRRLDDRFHVLSDPTSRKPERRRSLRSTIGWSYDLLFPDDQRGLWALATFAGGAPLPAVESVLEALDVPLSAAIDVVGRLAGRSLVIVDDEDVCIRPIPAPRQHPRVRARGDDRCRDVRAGPGRPRRVVRGRRRLLHARGAERPSSRAPRVRPGRARQHRRRPGVERRTRPVARSRHRQRVRVGVDRARRQQGGPADPHGARCGRRDGTRPGPRQRLAARGLDRSIDGSPGARSRAHRRGHRAGGRDRRRRPPSAMLPTTSRTSSPIAATSIGRWS